METFSKCNKLKRIALKLIAAMLPEKETEGLKTIFQKMDKDNDGWISLHELKSSMREKGAMVKPPTPFLFEFCLRSGSTICTA